MKRSLPISNSLSKAGTKAMGGPARHFVHPNGTATQRSPLSFLWHDIFALYGAIFVVLLVGAALFAPLLTPYPAQGAGDPHLENKFLAPTLAHPFGADHLGRD